MLVGLSRHYQPIWSLHYKHCIVENLSELAMAVRYAIDERVLCWHQDLVYEAKVLEVKRDAETPEYYVHYKGWKNTYVQHAVSVYFVHF